MVTQERRITEGFLPIGLCLVFLLAAAGCSPSQSPTWQIAVVQPAYASEIAASVENTTPVHSILIIGTTPNEGKMLGTDIQFIRWGINIFEGDGFVVASGNFPKTFRAAGMSSFPELRTNQGSRGPHVFLDSIGNPRLDQVMDMSREGTPVFAVVGNSLQIGQIRSVDGQTAQFQAQGKNALEQVQNVPIGMIFSVEPEDVSPEISQTYNP